MISESTLRRLAFIRYIYRLGEEQVRVPEPLNAAAVMLFQDSCELFLQLACECMNVGTQRVEFMEYFTLLDKKLAPNEVAERESIRRLNKSRVALKHHGTMPSQLDLESFRSTMLSFFELNTPKVFGLGFETVSLGHLVTGDDARERLMQADLARTEQRWNDALEHVAVALSHSLREHGVQTSPRHIWSSAFSAFDRRGAEVLRTMSESVLSLEVEVGLMRHGIDTRRLKLFNQLTPHVAIAMAGNVRIVHMGDQRVHTSDEVQFCYDFAIDTILELQRSRTVLNTLHGALRS
jgi:hypothetical protein